MSVVTTGNSAPTDVFAQTGYQVRLDWGVPGLRRLAPADIVVVVDVLRFSTTVTRALEGGSAVVPFGADDEGGSDGDGDARAATSVDGAAVVRAAVARIGPDGEAPVVLLGCLRNASAVARACLAIQHERARRTSVAVVPAGELTSGEPGAELRFAVEDLLGAGAVIAALSALSTDHTSPEAAAACEAAIGLRRAVVHLVSASGSGLELAARGRREEVSAASQADVTDVVPVLRDGAFVAFAPSIAE